MGRRNKKAQVPSEEDEIIHEQEQAEEQHVIEEEEGEDEVEMEQDDQEDQVEEEAIQQQDESNVLPPNPSFFQVITHPGNAVARKKFALGTMSMIIFPISSFFICFNYLFDGVIWSLPASSRLNWSAVASVVTVQLVMAGFIFSAMLEDDRSSEARKNTFSRRERKLLSQHLRNQVTQEAHRVPESPSLFSWSSSTTDKDDAENKKEQ